MPPEMVSSPAREVCCISRPYLRIRRVSCAFPKRLCSAHPEHGFYRSPALPCSPASRHSHSSRPSRLNRIGCQSAQSDRLGLLHYQFFGRLPEQSRAPIARWVAPSSATFHGFLPLTRGSGKATGPVGQKGLLGASRRIRHRQSNLRILRERWCLFPSDAAL